jgi:hypothetical protein
MVEDERIDMERRKLQDKKRRLTKALRQLEKPLDFVDSASGEEQG